MAGKPMPARTLVLAAVAVTATVVLLAIWPHATADNTGSSPETLRDGGVAPQADPAVPPALGLDEMSAERTAPANRRDLFRFGAAQPGPAQIDPGAGQPAQAPRGGRRGAPPAPPPADQPVLPAQPAPIPLRFVGLSDTPNGKVASLSDGTFVFNGREGDVIEGRWRIVRIGAESLVIERFDGTGRQTLRLAGG